MADSGQTLVAELAAGVGSLGVELADIAGNVDDVANRATAQTEQFEELHQTAETMVAAPERSCCRPTVGTWAAVAMC
jgi:methyl-accepting chemotaxis protein